MPMPSMNRSGESARRAASAAAVSAGALIQTLRMPVAATSVEVASRIGRTSGAGGEAVGAWRGAAEPERAVAELLRQARRLPGALHAERAVAGPDADAADVHAESLSDRSPPPSSSTGSTS